MKIYTESWVSTELDEWLQTVLFDDHISESWGSDGQKNQFVIHSLTFQKIQLKKIIESWTPKSILICPNVTE